MGYSSSSSSSCKTEVWRFTSQYRVCWENSWHTVVLLFWAFPPPPPSVDSFPSRDSVPIPQYVHPATIPHEYRNITRQHKRRGAYRALRDKGLWQFRRHKSNIVSLRTTRSTLIVALHTLEAMTNSASRSTSISLIFPSMPVPFFSFKIDLTTAAR